MKLSTALDGVHRIGIDSVAFIYLIEKNPRYIDVMRFIAQDVTTGQLHGFSASLALTEILVHPLRNADTALATQYSAIFQQSSGFDLVPLTSKIAYKAAELRAEHNLKTPDAIHVATAITSGCEAFLTNDSGIKRVTSIKILILADLELDPGTED